MSDMLSSLLSIFISTGGTLTSAQRELKVYVCMYVGMCQREEKVQVCLLLVSKKSRLCSFLYYTLHCLPTMQRMCVYLYEVCESVMCMGVLQRQRFM